MHRKIKHSSCFDMKTLKPFDVTLLCSGCSHSRSAAAQGNMNAFSSRLNCHTLDSSTTLGCSKNNVTPQVSVEHEGSTYVFQGYIRGRDYGRFGLQRQGNRDLRPLLRA